MSNPVVSAIEDRRSIRAYHASPLTKKELDELVRCALCSPSARNVQPWHFSVVQNRDLLEQINEEVVKSTGREGDVFYGAPAVFFLSADPSWHYSDIDCGIAVQTLALAAHSMGLGSVILGMPRAAFLGSRADEFRKALQFPEGHDFIIAIAVGRPAMTKEAHPVLDGKVTFID